MSFKDSRVSTFSKLNASDQTGFLKELGQSSPGPNSCTRLEQLNHLITQGIIQKEEQYNTLTNSQFNILKNLLPKIERISSTEYETPEAVVRRAFQNVAANVIYHVREDTGEKVEIDSLVVIRKQIEEEVIKEAENLLPLLKDSHPKLTKVYAHPNIDFTKAVTATPLSLNCGEGERGFDSFGEGTKKKIWMGLLNWERQTSEKSANQNVISMCSKID